MLEKLHFISLNYTSHPKVSECKVNTLNNNMGYTLHQNVNFVVMLDKKLNHVWSHDSCLSGTTKSKYPNESFDLHVIGFSI